MTCVQSPPVTGDGDDDRDYGEPMLHCRLAPSRCRYVPNQLLISPQKRLDLEPRAWEPRTWEPTRAHTHVGLVHGWGHWRGMQAMLEWVGAN